MSTYSTTGQIYGSAWQFSPELFLDHHGVAETSCTLPTYTAWPAKHEIWAVMPFEIMTATANSGHAVSPCSWLSCPVFPHFYDPWAAVKSSMLGRGGASTLLTQISFPRRRHFHHPQTDSHTHNNAIHHLNFQLISSLIFDRKMEFLPAEIRGTGPQIVQFIHPGSNCTCALIMTRCVTAFGRLVNNKTLWAYSS